MAERRVRARRLARRAAAAALVLAAAHAAPPADESAWVRQQVFERLADGVRLLRAGNARGAAVKLCWAADRALNSHEAAWLCGRALLASREPGRAVVYLELATDLQPRHLETWVTLGDAFLADGQIDRSRGAYFKALEIRTDHSRAYDGLARLAWQTGDEQRALELFADALEANPADAVARLNRGRLHLEAGRVGQALEDIREAARLRPEDGEVQLGLARVLLRAGLGNDALAAARRSSAIMSGDPRPRALEGRILLEAGDLATAERAARGALELDPDEAEARLVLGELLGRTDRIDDGLAVLVPPDPSRLSERELGELAAARERWERRRGELEALAERAAADDAPASVLVTLAEARLGVGDADRAAELARRAAASPGASPEELRHAAYVLGAAARPLEGERVLDRVLASGTARAEDFVNLAVARELTGDPRGARAAFERALALPDPPPEAHLGLARLALARGDEAEAVRHLRGFLAAGPDADAALQVGEALKRLAPEDGGRAAKGSTP